MSYKIEKTEFVDSHAIIYISSDYKYSIYKLSLTIKGE